MLRVPVLLLVLTSLASAGRFDYLASSASRGSVTDGTTSLGAFTLLYSDGPTPSNYINFQGVIDETLHVPMVGFLLPIADPTVLTTGVYTPADAASDTFSYSRYLPYVTDPTPGAILPWGYYTYIPGTYELKTTDTGTGLKYSITYQLQNPLGLVGNMTMNGNYSLGDENLTLNTSASYVYRDSSILITSRDTMVFGPEPGTLGLEAAAIGLLGWRLRRRRF